MLAVLGIAFSIAFSPVVISIFLLHTLLRNIRRQSYLCNCKLMYAFSSFILCIKFHVGRMQTIS